MLEGWRNAVRIGLVLAPMVMANGACGDGETTDGGGAGPTSASGSGSTQATGTNATSTTTSTTGAGGESPGPERAPGLTDASILFPFPASPAELGAMIKASDAGVGGPLLPLAMFEQLPDISFFLTSKPEHHAALRVVGARLDPCFRIQPANPCRRQVRLVMQPFVDEGTITSVDAAVHLFYDLDDAAFTGLLGDVTRAQSATDAEGPLRVHPAIDRDRITGTAGQAIRNAILARAGESRLTRITFMQLGGQANVWIFGGFEVAGGTLTSISIVGSGTITQQFDNNAIPDPLDFHGQVSPVLPPDDLSAFYESDDARQLTDDELWPSYESALRVQHPSHHTSESVSCVSCHTADTSIAWADRNTELGARPSALRFTSTFDLTPPSTIHADRSQTVRAFGYQDATPAVSTRTIAETTVVVTDLRAMYGF